MESNTSKEKGIINVGLTSKAMCIVSCYRNRTGGRRIHYL